MLKLFFLAAMMAVAAAKPGLVAPVAYTAPFAAGYTAPVAAPYSAYSAPLAYSAYSAHPSPYSAYYYR